jgi:cyclopropane fatty-acyl-phospholipid synthase-like methyltransferase
MSGRTEQSVANSLEVDKRLLSHMPFLLQDLWALGSSIDYIMDVVGGLNLPSHQTKVLDLGCGKGAVSIGIASKFGFRIVGIDVMNVFLEYARKKAMDYNVSHLCEFINQDIMEYVSVEHGFDLVILASLGGVIGSFTDTIAALRCQVRSGGYMLVDDGYLREDGFLKRKGYEHYKSHKDTIKELTFFNDFVLKEINTTALSLKINSEYLEVITHRGMELAAEHPELEEYIRSYIRVQEEECHVIQDQMEGALWLVQKR